MSSQRPLNQGNRRDPWWNTYSDRAQNLRESEVRSLFSVVSRPEVVSLAGGMPNIKDLPLDKLADSVAELVRQHGAQALQYGQGRGWDPIRRDVCEIMAKEGIDGDYENVVITTGSQQAVDLITQIFVNPGDVILCEAPSYVGSLGIFGAYQADIRHVAMDHDGLLPDALEAAIKQARAEGKAVKFLYTIPNFHNPAGVTQTMERRRAIIEICDRLQVLIVEDNPYGLLGFSGDPLPALQSLNPEGVVYLGSFSKMFAPGYRVGWALAPHAIRDKLVLANESAVLSPSMMSQMTIHAYMQEFDWFAQVQTYRGMYQERRDAMLESLEQYLPICEWTKPSGGFYTWVKLPAGLDAKDMLPRAVTGLVAYVSGTAFYADGQGRDHLRLSYCFPPPDEIREGVRRLAEVVNREKELVDLFGGVELTPVQGLKVDAPDAPRSQYPAQDKD
ncbi:GntR family transcriptional regulator [Boudabousia liubingyangii]|uniref:GntR family transcriptional regulator n=1 Tax=Boudabousia liubingyangii TaxID=1921764 RepID=A0A1Q5PPG1_9ACTO|nr:PLP-dependent aminotransferase family protein [Boudabousia liubingyangii]OKL48551.1 GntR family transcriptional regulator [Boudabousia liubingyangii]OKL49413.1 GntR family transcriptional regulator [Boudabousia liubingyangii]